MGNMQESVYSIYLLPNQVLHQKHLQEAIDAVEQEGGR